jgi:hypothetical protein
MRYKLPLATIIVDETGIPTYKLATRTPRYPRTDSKLKYMKNLHFDQVVAGS